MVSIKKIQTVKDLSEIISSSSNIALIGFGNTKHQNLENVRKELKKISAKLRVIKNSLIIKTLKKLAVDNKKYKNFEKETQNLKEKTALLCLPEDYISGLNTIEKLSKTDETISFKLGFLDGNIYYSDKLKQIANLPSKNQLYFQLISQLKTPITKIMYLFNSPAVNLLRIINTRSESLKKQGGDQ